MKRNELEIGSRYAGPEGRCYEIVDLSPGWRISGSGDWVEDRSTRSRHMPNRGETAYRSNLAVQAYLIRDPGMDDEVSIKSVVDPRRLTERWDAYEARMSEQEVWRVHTNRLVALLRRNLRTYPGHAPSPSSAYAVSADGGSVTLPMKDLSALMDVAFSGKP